MYIICTWKFHESILGSRNANVVLQMKSYVSGGCFMRDVEDAFSFLGVSRFIRYYYVLFYISGRVGFHREHPGKFIQNITGIFLKQYIYLRLKSKHRHRHRRAAPRRLKLFYSANAYVFLIFYFKTVFQQRTPQLSNGKC